MKKVFFTIGLLAFNFLSARNDQMEKAQILGLSQIRDKLVEIKADLDKEFEDKTKKMRDNFQKRDNSFGLRERAIKSSINGFTHSMGKYEKDKK